MDIRAVLARRVDLSTFLVHLTRNIGQLSGRNALHGILDSWRIDARNSFGPAADPLANGGLPDMSQRCVCFTETPLEHTYWLLQEIDGRAVRLAPYGVAFPKKWAAPGFVDTLFRAMMRNEVKYGTSNVFPRVQA
jgi:hypothetical protein